MSAWPESKDPESLSDSAARVRHKSSKKERINMMKNKMKAIMAKVDELEKEKSEDRQQLQKLMGDSNIIERMTESHVIMVEQMKNSKLAAEEPTKRAQSLQKDQKKKPQSRKPPAAFSRPDQSYLKREDTYIKQVKKQKIRMKNQAVANFILALFVGVVLIFLGMAVFGSGL